MTHRLITLICFLTVFTLIASSQSLEFHDFNGWEYFKWTYHKKQVEEILKAKGIDFDPGQTNQKHGPTTEFVFNDMKTRLAYDMGHLYDVQQYKYYGAAEREKADLFYKQLKISLIKKYGLPLTEKEYTSKKEIHVRWEVKYTKIDLYYSYDNIVIKGLEDQTFSISVHINAL